MRFLLGGIVVFLIFSIGCGRNAEYYINQGDKLISQGNIREAIKKYERAVKADAKSHVAHSSLGIAFCLMGDYDAGIEHLRRSVELKDDFVEGHYNLARALGLRGELKEALAEYKKVVMIDSTYALAYLGAGELLADMKMPEQAMVAFKKAIHFSPNLVQARMALAAVYIGLERYDDAIAELSEARKFQPANLDLLSMAARAAMLKKDFNKAVDLFKELVSLDSENPAYRNDYAAALMLSGQRELAISEWEGVLKMNPSPDLENVVKDNLSRARRQ
ncbi:MAG: tetratricopeptide repeat protein [bacterium]